MLSGPKIKQEILFFCGITRSHRVGEAADYKKGVIKKYRPEWVGLDIIECKLEIREVAECKDSVTQPALTNRVLLHSIGCKQVGIGNYHHISHSNQDIHTELVVHSSAIGIHSAATVVVTMVATITSAIAAKEPITNDSANLITATLAGKSVITATTTITVVMVAVANVVVQGYSVFYYYQCKII